MTPKLAVAVNLAQLVALASHSKFSLQNQTKKKINDSWSKCLSQSLYAYYEIHDSILAAQLPKELITGRSCVHERVGYYCGCVAH